MKAVIFDLGNVVVRWDPRAVFRDHFATDAEVARFMDEIGFADWNLGIDAGRDWDEAVAALSVAHPRHAVPIAAYRDRLMDAHPALLPGVADLIAELDAAGVPLFALSNTSVAAAARLALKYPEVLRRFRDVVVSAAVGAMKPDPEIFRIALARNDLKAGETIFVDDSPENVEGARAAGLDAIHFTDAEALALALRDRGLLQ